MGCDDAVDFFVREVVSQFQKKDFSDDWNEWASDNIVACENIRANSNVVKVSLRAC